MHGYYLKIRVRLAPWKNRGNRPKFFSQRENHQGRSYPEQRFLGDIAERQNSHSCTQLPTEAIGICCQVILPGRVLISGMWKAYNNISTTLTATIMKLLITVKVLLTLLLGSYPEYWINLESCENACLTTMRNTSRTFGPIVEAILKDIAAFWPALTYYTFLYLIYVVTIL